jgi:hypothetical protein
VDFVKTDAGAENGNKERHRRNQSVPDPKPKTGDFSFGIGGFFRGIGSRSAAPGKKRREDEKNEDWGDFAFNDYSWIRSGL